MEPPAPARLSTITDCPRTLPRATGTGRATMSVFPPGANGTTRVTGLLGNPCAHTGAPSTLLEAATALSLSNCRRWICIVLSPGRCNDLASVVEAQDILDCRLDACRLSRVGCGHRRAWQAGVAALQGDGSLDVGGQVVADQSVPEG